MVAHLHGNTHFLFARLRQSLLLQKASLQSPSKQITLEQLLLHLYLAAACLFDLSAFLGPDDDLFFDLWQTFNSELNV